MTEMKLPEAGDRIGFGPRKSPRTADWNGVRKGEQIGGGFFVFRRGERGGRIFISQMPYEHPSREAAQKEAQRLREKHPGQVYQVFGAVE